MSRLLEFLEEKGGSGTPGKLSSSRLFSLMVAVATIIDWMHAVFTVGTWDPNITTIGFVLGVLGFKVLQKQKELN